MRGSHFRLFYGGVIDPSYFDLDTADPTLLAQVMMGGRDGTENITRQYMNLMRVDS